MLLESCDSIILNICCSRMSLADQITLSLRNMGRKKWTRQDEESKLFLN
jgi:hypothetical protein